MSCNSMALELRRMPFKNNLDSGCKGISSGLGMVRGLWGMVLSKRICPLSHLSFTSEEVHFI